MLARGLAVAITAAVGVMVAFQAPINSRLGKSVGTFPAAVVSFGVGTILLVGITLLFGGGFGRVGAVRELPWWVYLGGLFGAAFVSASLVAVRTLGATGVVAGVIAGQLTASVLIDQFGLIGVPRQPVGVLRLAGVALLALGTYLVVRE